MNTTSPASTTHHEPCLDCHRSDGVRWVTSTPDTDTWTCRHCGTERTITIHTSRGLR